MTCLLDCQVGQLTQLPRDREDAPAAFVELGGVEGDLNVWSLRLGRPRRNDADVGAFLDGPDAIVDFSCFPG